MDHPASTPAPAHAGTFNPFAIDDDEPDVPAPAPVATPAASAASAATTTTEPAPTDTAAAAETAPATEPSPADPANAELARYAKRRRTYSAVALALVALVLWNAKPWQGLLPAGTTTTASPGTHEVTQAARPGGDLIGADMRVVHERLRQTTDLFGTQLPGADVAARGENLYAARVINGQCVVYGVSAGKDIAPQSDPTGQACHGQIRDVQAQLDQADTLRRAQTQSAADDALRRAADTAAFYASQNFAGGAPSLTGLPTTGLGAVTVVTNHGDWASLQARSGGTCRTAIVAATGELGEISTC